MKLVSKKKLHKKNVKYDIGTKNHHNFFANGILVHNSNSRHGLIEGEWMVGSHNMRLKYSETNRWWYVFNDNMKEMLTSLTDEFEAKQVIMFGEIFGPGIQKGYTYGIPQGTLSYRCFDIKIDGKYLSWDKLWKTCGKHNVMLVPVLYRGPLNMESIIKTFGKSKTTLEQANIMEGVVIKLVEEELRIYGGSPKRTILKYVFDQYLDPKNKTTENH